MVHHGRYKPFQKISHTKESGAAEQATCLLGYVSLNTQNIT